MLKIRIRTKLAASLAVPLVALVGVSGFEALQASDEAGHVRAEAELATVAIGPSSLTTELQNERNYTAIELIGLSGAATLEVSSVAEGRQRVDTAVAELETFLEGRPQVVAEAFAPAFEVLEAELASTRSLYDDFDGDFGLENQELAEELFDGFTTMTTAFFGATQSIATEIDDTALRNGSELVDQSNRRSELLASITRTIVIDTLSDSGGRAFRADAAGQIERVRAIEERIELLSVGPYEAVADTTLNRSWDEETQDHFEDYLSAEPIDLSALLAAVSAGGADDVTSSSEMATDILEAEARRLTSAADERKTLFLLLAAGVVALAVVVSWLASRSITRPLRRLRTEAHHMATERLPSALREIVETPFGEDVVVPELDPIVIKTRDEVREVVHALNDVQDHTLALVADQAVLRRNIADSFVNLGRRNQHLLDRQLEFITELEQSETEPEELESLFRLDHLATRMRRNAESLLVLAGVESPRQWSGPVAGDDVIRAALGEVEDYRRVAIRHIDDVQFAGEVASSLSHVLAELTENALNFSPPNANVELKGRHGDGGYLIAIDDDGIGMSAEELERANRRLSGEESYTIAPSRYLGHYVAGHLAQRFGIELRLQDRPAGGVTALLTVPAELVVGGGADEMQELQLDPITSTLEQRQPQEPPVRVAVGGPETLAEALGRPQIDSIQSGDDLTAAIDGTGQPVPPSAGGSSLPRRVPGAQRPDLEPTVARRPAPAEPDASTPRNPLGFLAGFSSAGGDGLFGDKDATAPSEEDR